MAVIRCDKGHYYDDEKYPSCPHCLGGADQADDDSLTIVASDSRGHTSFMQQSNSAISDRLTSLIEDEKTISFSRSHDFDPVAGWLVCVRGSERGRDFRIHAGQNFQQSRSVRMVSSL